MKRAVRLFLLILLLAPASWAQKGRTVVSDGIREEAPAGPVIEMAAPSVRHQPDLRVGPGAASWASRLTGTAAYVPSLGKSSAALLKLDAETRLLLAARAGLGKSSAALLERALPETAVRLQSGDVMVDVLMELAPGASTAALEAQGAQVQSVVGNIAALRVPLDALEAMAARHEVQRVEASRLRRPTMAASRADIRADLVHNGVGLPGPVQGEGVIVGVLDSGIDVTHPDFFNEGGSRVQFLLEYLSNGGQAEWSKAQIDGNVAGVTQRDGNGAGGHGTHVTGTAAGSGRSSASMRGIAPKSDIIFVKGIRDADSNGGFSDNDVVAGVQYIFNRATQLNKPAVVNLSLGGNGGPLDGTSLQERALSQLVGPGRLIVAAGGNEGFDLIHAGGTTVPGAFNQAMLLPAGPGMSMADIWYEQGSVAEVGLAAYYIDQSQSLQLAAFSGWLPVGQFANWQPFVVEGMTVAEFAIDAQTTRDPGNGDGNALVAVRGDEQTNPADWIWGILVRGPQANRVDMWATGGEFLGFTFGLQDFNEFAGNTDQTIGSPASAERVIAVASYVTTNSWTSFDGNRYQWQNPNPSRQGNPVVPALGQRSYFSSIGPTRDGRQKPQIAAPGELIFSALSSHLTAGTGYQPALRLSSERYLGMQGTSMASPHIAGVVALMLQVNPRLDFEDALDILTSTARTDAQTGTLPSYQWGAGRVDALAAVQEAHRRAGGQDPGGTLQRATLTRFDPTGVQRNYVVESVMPLDSGFVAGMNYYGDRAKATSFDLPAGVTTAEVTEVNVWFGYKKPGATRKYAIEIFDATGGAAPGTPLFRQEFDFSHALADADFATTSAPTTHTLSAPVRVNGPFYVSIDFGAYTAADAGALSIVSTDLVGARVPHVWEKWGDNRWANMSDAWWGSNGAPGDDGVNLWIQAGVQYTVSTPVEGGEHPSDLHLRLAGPNPFRDATTLSYGVPQAGHVSLEVYDLLGRRVATLVEGLQPAGTYTVPFAADGLASGLYLARLEAGGRTVVQRLVRAQ